jgi:TonB family protein
MLDSRAALSQQAQQGADAASAERPSTPVPDKSVQDKPVQDKPVPDKDGVYAVVDGIVPPAMVSAVPPVFPASVTTELANPLICLLSAVIGVDGTVSKVQVTRGCNEVFSDAAIDSVTHSQYQPGTLEGKPVPVLVHVRVAFQDPLFANAPRLALRYREASPNARPSRKLYDTPPRPLQTVEAQFSDKARRNGTEGTVIISTTVDEMGLPTDVQVVHGVGDGLDEEAVKAVRHYRFKPAMKDGSPVPAKISVEVSFRLYSRPRN